MATTAKDTIVNGRIDGDTLKQLDEIAAAMQRTRSFLIARAVREFVEREYPFLCAVQEGEADLDAGRSLPHEEVLQWAEELKAGKAVGPPSFHKRKRRPA